MTNGELCIAALFVVAVATIGFVGWDALKNRKPACYGRVCPAGLKISYNSHSTVPCQCVTEARP